MIGRPVTVATDSAAPPRASPSSLVSTTPSKPTPSRNACAVVTASWPIIASTTNRISSGCTASRMSAACCISSASTPSRPAVSTMTTSYMLLLRRARSRRARRPTGSPTPLPGSGANTGTPARSPTTCSWVTALGRCRSAATSTRRVALAAQPVGELAGERRLAGALQAGEHDHGRRVLGEPQPAGLAAEDRDELLVDDLDDLLRRVERLVHLGALRALPDRGDEVARPRAARRRPRAARPGSRGPSRRCRRRSAGPCRAGS